MKVSRPVELAREAQLIAVQACQRSKAFLKPGISEKEFAAICERIMKELGADQVWYPMLVNFGSNSVYCTRRDHLPSPDVILQASDIVLVDYSPLVQGYWGDYSETIQIGEDPFLAQLIYDAKSIFEATYTLAKTAATIGEVFTFCRRLIADKGYELLDPNGNIGHSIEHRMNHDQRTYIYPPNSDVLLQGRTWAIEPHIGKNGYGAKFEHVVER